MTIHDPEYDPNASRNRNNGINEPAPRPYYLREHPDGGLFCICPGCYIAIANAKTEGELDVLFGMHRCSTPLPRKQPSSERLPDYRPMRANSMR
jgi:hypothetical protein